MSETLRGLCIGAGYFSQFHFEAWKRVRGARIAGVVDLDAEKAGRAAAELGCEPSGPDAVAAMDALRPDFVDIITPPATHLELVTAAAERGLAVLCQKPLAPTAEDARRLVATCQSHGTRLMVHENFRFQPWHREIRRLIEAGAIGQRLHALAFRTRTGDGWQDDAYLARQPYFRGMRRFLIHETGIDFIDTFRYLAGEIDGVYALLRRLNPAIAGEDTGLVIFEFASGAVGLWDANRYNEPNTADPRYTFGEFLVEGTGGSIRLHADGRLTLQKLGREEEDHPYVHERRGFGGDCVHRTLEHFVDALASGDAFETGGEEYLRNIAIEEAVYRSAETGLPIRGLCGESREEEDVG